jgi:hypothetical protein
MLCQKVDKSASETFSNDQVSVQRRSLGRSAVLKWHKHSAQKKDSVDGEEHTGQQERSELNSRSKEF